MKLLILALVILSICNYCAAAANRSTLWVFADEQIYSAQKGYQKCAQLAATSTPLVTTTYFTLTGVDTGIFAAPPGATAGAASSTIFGLQTLVLTMIYSDGGTTANIQKPLNAFTDPSALSTSLAAGTYSSANGNTWFKIAQVGSSPNTAATGAQGISWNSMMITDYRSNTTIVITAWQDGVDDGTHFYNHIYMVSIRTLTSLLTAGTDKMVGGCTSRTRRRRAVEDEVVVPSPRGGSSCSTSNSWDSSLQDTQLDTVCSTASTSSTYLKNAIAVAVANLNSVKSIDDALFAAAGSKFAIAANFGVLIAMSSVVFSLLN